MSSNPRATYIPPAKRKRQNQQTTRFHGAFTGGFSAGFFNTVDTKEGWKPSAEQRREQKLEDFMDEQDHQEWGGPTSIRQEFNEKDNEISKASKAAAPLDSLLKISRPQTVGLRLLRRLGWREGSGAAFVPADAGEDITAPTKEGQDDSISKIHLSKKRIKRIQLQSTRIKLPPPKLDQCGLGFEAHDNAPEFRRHREQRQELARSRARGQSNVYRVSNVLGGSDDGSPTTANDKASGGDYRTYDTAEDFVGSRSVGGFALRDDEDDTYDPLALGTDRNNCKPTSDKRLSEEYNTEIVELDEDSDVEDGATTAATSSAKLPKDTGHSLGGALASWATGGSKETAKDSATPRAPPASALTSSGRPPVAGFRLGGSMESHKKRYPGPDIPRDYTLKRHIFGPNERPAIFQTIGRAIQLEGEEQARQKRRSERRSQPTQKEPSRTNQPSLAGNQFATLATAMKNRFTSATAASSGSGADGNDDSKVGLYQPPSVQTKIKEEKISDQSNAPSTTKKSIVVHRTTQSFAPLPLLCKRFGVPVPRHVTASANVQSNRVTEASYFEKEVLSSAREGNNQTKDKKIEEPKAEEARSEFGLAEEADIPRPSMDKLKAIFEPDSDNNSSDDTDLDSMEDNNSSTQETKTPGQDRQIQDDSTSKDRGQNLKLVEYESRDLAFGNDTDSEPDNANRSESSSSRRRNKKRRKNRHKKKKRSSKKRKRSKRYEGSSEDDASSGDAGSTVKERERESREGRRKHSKKRKERHSSSQRK